MITALIAGTAAFLASNWALARIIPEPRMPKEPPRRIPDEPPLPWSPGDSAFWLDPDLWNRTPETDGAPDICWMYLDGPLLRCENEPNFSGYFIENDRPVPVIWGTCVTKSEMRFRTREFLRDPETGESVTHFST